MFDAAPIGSKFGAVITDVLTTTAYNEGDTVSALFVGADPRVRFLRERSIEGSTMMVIFFSK